MISKFNPTFTSDGTFELVLEARTLGVPETFLARAFQLSRDFFWTNFLKPLTRNQSASLIFPAKISGIKILASPLLNLRFCLDARLLTLSTAPAVDKLLWTRIKTVMALPLSTRNLFNILAILSAFARVCAFHFRLAAGTPGWTASFPATTF